MNIAKVITPDNYYKPCEAASIHVKMGPNGPEPLSEIDYINALDSIKINIVAPEKVIELFETARALYMYGYLYWTFFTLAYEQALKAWEMAIVCKLEDASIEKMPNKLIDKIKKLKNLNIINNLEEEHFHIIRITRNQLAHPKYQSELGHTNGFLQVAAEQINLLYMLDRGI